MRLNELKSVFLKNMGYYTQDLSRPSEFEQFMPEALAFMNEGYALVASHTRYKDAQRVTLEKGGALPFSELRYPFQRCLSVNVGGRSVCPELITADITGGRLVIGGAAAGDEAEITYVYIPAPLREDEDEPCFLPKALHHALADYAAARVLFSRVGGEAKAQALLNAFYTALGEIVTQRAAEGGVCRFYNKY